MECPFLLRRERRTGALHKADPAFHTTVWISHLPPPEAPWVPHAPSTAYQPLARCPTSPKISKKRGGVRILYKIQLLNSISNRVFPVTNGTRTVFDFPTLGFKPNLPGVTSRSDGSVLLLRQIDGRLATSVVLQIK